MLHCESTWRKECGIRWFHVDWIQAVSSLVCLLTWRKPDKPTMAEVDVLKITNEDAAFILGKGGRTSTPCAAPANPTSPLPAHSRPSREPR